MWPLIEICWKKTYSIPSSSIRFAISAIFSARPGALRASSSVCGAGPIFGEENAASTSLGTSSLAAIVGSFRLRSAVRGDVRSRPLYPPTEQKGTFGPRDAPGEERPLTVWLNQEGFVYGFPRHFA